MAADIVQFVDSIASSPTVRLNLNDETSWWIREFDAPPPPLRRNLVSNAMTDGGYMSSSNYEPRQIQIVVDLRTSTQDTNATALQSLARELDRETNILKWQTNGLTSPVFFKTWRGSMDDVQEWQVSAAHRQLTITLLAEPFGLGLRETVSVGTVNNDPAAGSNGCYFDVSSVKGDVPAPFVMTDTADFGDNVQIMLAVRQTGTPSNMKFFIQAESLSSFTDTSNPGGAADAAMSGSGTTNYLRTTFATTSGLGSTRFGGTFTSSSTELAELAGDYRVLLAVRRSSAVGTVSLAVRQGASGSLFLFADTSLYSTRQYVDMGVYTFSSDRATVTPDASLGFDAARTSGASTIDFDCVIFVPADRALAIISNADSTSGDLVIDGEAGSVYSVSNAANLFTATAIATNDATYIGSLPRLAPGVTNRFIYLKSSASGQNFDKSYTGTVTLYYHPLYFNIRPSTT